MRKRLIAVFLVPLTLLLAVLGGAYAWSIARTVQQEAFAEQLADLGYFLTGARQALRAGDATMLETELSRYGELYDAEVAVFDRGGALWASGGTGTGKLDADREAEVRLALSGRRSEAGAVLLPWELGETAIVEPVIDDGTVIGAVMVVTGSESPRREILTQWAVLGGVGALVVAALVWAVFRVASWVLRPLHRVDAAMAAIEAGEMDARISDGTGPPEVQGMVRMFNQMAEEIERVVSRQQEFAMNASHELRNPLGALLLRVEYLATGLDAGWEDDIELAREEGRRMSRILDTLLSMARAGKTDSAFAACDLGELARMRVEAWRERAEEGGVQLRVRGRSALLSVTDRTALETALDGIIDNALKFAPRGTAVDVSVAERDGEHVLSVRDRGRGLPAAELAQATGRFWRSPRDQNVPGSGLGLSIASDLLTALGGGISLAAPAGGGLEVSLHLPAVDR